MFIETETEERLEQLLTRLPKIFGIQSFSAVAAAEKNMDAIKAVAKERGLKKSEVYNEYLKSEEEE